MKKCNHENVVKFHGLEQMPDPLFVKYVLAMEYTDSGNLMQLIDKHPEGLGSNEFYRVAKDLIGAIEYLHSNHLIHRDLKPDNMLVFKKNEEFQYKIADFGFARELRPNETYSSLYGTFEYLHPHIFAMFYYKALGIRPPVHAFSDLHELWSMGVFLYEVATGKLPFNPKHGRVDVQTMYEMIGGKKDGQISATEHEGKVVFEKDLPPGCQIENKDQVTRFLAGLLKVSIG